jgi:predicted RNA-binding Zn-ribbon protein involved in translation (DUF1610 family)
MSFSGLFGNVWFSIGSLAVIALLIGSHAKKNGRSGGFWVFGIILFGAFGLLTPGVEDVPLIGAMIAGLYVIISLIRGGGTQNKFECPSCGVMIREDVSRCPSCGSHVGTEYNEARSTVMDGADNL